MVTAFAILAMFQIDLSIVGVSKVDCQYDECSAAENSGCSNAGKLPPLATLSFISSFNSSSNSVLVSFSHFSSISFFATLSSFSITSFPFISTCSQFLVSPTHSPQNPPPFLPPPSPSNSSSSTICSLCKTQMTFYLLPSTLQLSTEV